MGKSVLAQFGWMLLERGISFVPIAPGTKRPGKWSAERGWEGMGDWSRFSDRLPTLLELEIWETWPDAGIGITLGAASGLICLDKDYEIPGPGNAALDAILPYSPIAKKGAKGWTRFYRWRDEPNASFDVGGMRVLDVLAHGRQTVIPPTAHPDGMNYTWITLDTLYEIASIDDLPYLPVGFLDLVRETIKPFQTDDDRKYQRENTYGTSDAGAVCTDLSIQAQFFRDINNQALTRLDEWVPRFVHGAKSDGRGGYRCIATWRGCERPNVGITPLGVRDWGKDYGMTPIDLVMSANNLTAIQAAESLRAVLAIQGTEAITMTVGGVPIGAAPPAPAPPSAPPPAPAPPPSAPAVPRQAEDGVLVLPEPDDAPRMPRFVTDPPGMLKEVANWITAIAPKPQPELALSAAIALGCTVTQRIYRSNLQNLSSLFLVNLAASGEGKEQPLGAVERILVTAGLGALMGGSGYTSSGAVYSSLMRSPSHLATIDEFGKLLKMSRAKGNANSEAAIDKLVEVFGRVNGVLRPPAYSTMTLSKSQASQLAPTEIHNPAVTVLGAATPGTFYGGLTDDLVQDGFLNRLIVVESSLPLRPMVFEERGGYEVPERIIKWVQAVNTPTQRQGNLADLAASNIPPNLVTMRFEDGCMDMLNDFAEQLNTEKQRLVAERLDSLLVRTHEKAMRLSMVAAKALDPGSLVIPREALAWALNYVHHYDQALVLAVRKNRVSGPLDEYMRKMTDIIKGARKMADDPKLARFSEVLREGGVPHQLLLKRMRLSAREFGMLIETAHAAGVIHRPGIGKTPSYPAGEVYFMGDDY